jgi:hypothetical protein
VKKDLSDTRAEGSARLVAVPNTSEPRRRRAANHRTHWLIAVSALAAIAAAATTLSLVLARSQPSGPRTVSVAEADRLAVMRYRNYESRGRSVMLTVPTVAGTISIRGSVDFRSHVGYGVIEGDGQSSSTRGLVQWTLRSIAEHPLAEAPATPPAVPPARGWIGRALAPKASALDSALLLVLNLAANRPDNAQLLRQHGATWLRSTTIRSTRVDVLAGPAPSGPLQPDATHQALRYWLGRDGTLYRVESSGATAARAVIVDLGGTPFVPVTPVRGLR